MPLSQLWKSRKTFGERDSLFGSGVRPEAPRPNSMRTCVLSPYRSGKGGVCVELSLVMFQLLPVHVSSRSRITCSGPKARLQILESSEHGVGRRCNVNCGHIDGRRCCGGV